MKSHRKLITTFAILIALGIVGTAIAITYYPHTEITDVSITGTLSDGDSVAISSNHTMTCSDSNDTDKYCDDTGWHYPDDPVTLTWSGPGAFDPATGPSVTWTAPSSTGDKTITVTADDSPLCDETEKTDSITVTVVKVDKIQYNDPVTGYTDIGSTLYVHRGTTVTFKAIPNPVGASWPSGKPVWGGSSGASGTGSTKAVTFNVVSSSTTDYKTVTAECGNTVTVNVIVYSATGFTTPKDDFPGGSPTRFGVYEEVDCWCVIIPTGLTGTQVGGLRWNIQSGVGTLSSITNDGTALYKAHTSAGSVTLRLSVQSGPSKGFIYDILRDIVEPNGGTCVKRLGTNIWHVRYTYSIGVNTNMYLTPTDVSFKWIEFQEGFCYSQITGWYIPEFNGTYHTAWTGWIGVGGGHATDGCRILQPNGDFAELYDYSPKLPYSSGTFLWDIPWSYKAGTYTKNFCDMNQEFTVAANGRAEVRKDSTPWFFNYHSWRSRSY